MTVNIRGKEYKTVAERVNEFRGEHPDEGIVTEIVFMDEKKVVMKATILHAEDNSVIATGHAEEFRVASRINETSALENCETSAVGRALANYGLAGTEFASAEEVSQAIINQQVNEAKKSAKDFYANHNKSMLDNIDGLMLMRESMGLEDLSSASEVWFELSEAEQKTLFIAPSSGGFFTTKEREVIKSKEFREAYYGVQDE